MDTGLRDRQIDGARIEWILVNDLPIVSTGLRSAALRSSNEAVPILTITRVVKLTIHFHGDTKVDLVMKTLTCLLVYRPRTYYSGEQPDQVLQN